MAQGADGRGLSLPVLRTERLVLRPWHPDEAEHAFRIYSDPEVMRYLGGGGEVATSVEALRTRMGQRAEVIATSYPPGQGVWGAWLEDRAVGTGLLKPLPDGDDRPTDAIEVGWHLARDAWGHGYATEIGRRLVRYGFDDLGLETIHAVVDAPNTGSHRVCERLGMHRVGTTERWYGQPLVHYVTRRPGSTEP